MDITDMTMLASRESKSGAKPIAIGFQSPFTGQPPTSPPARSAQWMGRSPDGSTSGWEGLSRSSRETTGRASISGAPTSFPQTMSLPTASSMELGRRTSLERFSNTFRRSFKASLLD